MTSLSFKLIITIPEVTKTWLSFACISVVYHPKGNDAIRGHLLVLLSLPDGTLKQTTKLKKICIQTDISTKIIIDTEIKLEP